MGRSMTIFKLLFWDKNKSKSVHISPIYAEYNPHHCHIATIICELLAVYSQLVSSAISLAYWQTQAKTTDQSLDQDNIRFYLPDTLNFL